MLLHHCFFALFLLVQLPSLSVLATLTITLTGQPTVQLATRAPLFAAPIDATAASPVVDGQLLRGHFQMDDELACQLVQPLRATRSNSSDSSDKNKRPILLAVEHYDALENNCTSLAQIRTSVAEYSTLRVQAGHAPVAALIYMPNLAVGGQHMGGPADHAYVLQSMALRKGDVEGAMLPVAILDTDDTPRLKRAFFDAVAQPIRGQLEHGK